ncbi:MAG: cell envelope integrity protein CreD [Sphingomonadaceae bacterium]|nr:cell envelope integrity protein CreD [Sphingomonadaceae bacterium]
MSDGASTRSPGVKLILAILIAAALSVPLFMTWFIVYDRQQQSAFAATSITEGWAGPQAMRGPLLVIPYRTNVSETTTENGREVTRTHEVWQKLTLAPEASDMDTGIRPELRHRSIYEVVVYQAEASGQARFAMPADLSRLGLSVEQMDLSRAELRFGLSDPRGLGANPSVSVDGQPLRLQPGGAGGALGFFAWIDAGALAGRPLQVAYRYAFRGTGSLSLAPQAGDTRWHVHSPWPSPSFQGGFLPADRRIDAQGFDATYRVGNLALGQPIAAVGEEGPAAGEPARAADSSDGGAPAPGAAANSAQISLLQTVDLYDQVNRASKYGFLFIGFTFLAFLMFDIIGGVRVSPVEYLLVGVSLILFFVLLLAFAEVIGFLPAYALAAAGITLLNTAYSAAVLKSWRRAGIIGGLLAGLYAVLYVLLSLEAYSLLIGSVLLFLALGAVMYATRNLNWGGEPAIADLA